MEISGLASFLLDEYFSNWKSNRQNMFDEKWTRNLEAFERISSSFWKAEEAEGWRSDTFVGLTKMKILSAWSIIIDTFLEENKFPFALKPAPVDKIVLEELPREERGAILDEIDDMARVIRQQLKDSKASRELMKCVMSAAIYGETFAKRYVQAIPRPSFQDTGFGRLERVVDFAHQPGWEYVSNWAIFRDYEIEDIEDCAGIVQVDYTSAFMLRKSIGMPGFIPGAIEDVISEFASQKVGGNEGSSRGSTGQDYDTDWGSPPASAAKNMTRYTSVIPRKEFWCRVPREMAEEFEAGIDKDNYFTTDTGAQYDGDEVEIMAIVAGTDIVRYARVSKEERPFYWAPWELRLDFPGGAGVADNVEQSQVVLNGMVRAFEDNKKLSGNVILAAKESFFQKMDDTVKPGMKIKLSEDTEKASDALHSIIIPDVGDSLLSGIGLFERYADEESQLPKILQGAQHEKQKADTAFELNQLQTNAGKYIGGVIKNLDENLIEPLITDFYEYNMEDPDIEVVKRNLVVEAIGFASYQDKVIRLQKLMQLFDLVTRSEAVMGEANIRDLIRELSIALSVDPSISLKRPEEKQAEEDAAAVEAERARAMEDDRFRIENEKDMSDAEHNAARADLARSEIEVNQSDIRVSEAESAVKIRMMREGGQEEDKAKGAGDNKPAENNKKLKAV